MSQIGTKSGRNGDYRQTREFGENEEPIKDTDWTDHGRPNDHTNPHDHKMEDNPNGGTKKRGLATPMGD